MLIWSVGVDYLCYGKVSFSVCIVPIYLERSMGR